MNQVRRATSLIALRKLKSTGRKMLTATLHAQLGQFWQSQLPFLEKIWFHLPIIWELVRERQINKIRASWLKTANNFFHLNQTIKVWDWVLENLYFQIEGFRMSVLTLWCQLQRSYLFIADPAPSTQLRPLQFYLSNTKQIFPLLSSTSRLLMMT
jgi:hypothetical protein